MTSPDFLTTLWMRTLGRGTSALVRISLVPHVMQDVENRAKTAVVTRAAAFLGIA
jgi:hypothetical protein